MGGERRVSAVDEDEYYPITLQEELNEIIQAFYEAVSDEDILAYQGFVEDVMGKKVAEGAVREPEVAPDFELEDQDGDKVRLYELLEKGPVVLLFYRGKWCPHCNATLMRWQENLEKVLVTGATLVAISPMLPDGTQFLASKRCLKFPVCSDVGNKVAKKFRISFEVSPEFRKLFLKWGEDVPGHNGDDSWEIPLPATYLIDQNAEIILSVVENDPRIRAEVEDIVEAIPIRDDPAKQDNGRERRSSGLVQRKNRTESKKPTKKNLSATFSKGFKKVFGRRNETAPEYLGHFMCR